MRKVLIATPTYDGKLEAFYVNSLIVSIELARSSNISLIPIWMSYDALVQRSRNDLIKIAVENNFDDIIWIDADIEWNPDWLIKLLQYNYDVIGGTYRKKTDEEELYTVKTNNIKIDNNIMEVEGIGTGFMRMSKKAFTSLWDNSETYKNDGKEGRMVFDVIIDNGELVGEDILVCKKLKDLGFKIYLDTTMTCAHIGYKKYYGDFQQWINKIK
jgi:hypothetical protein